MNEHTRNRVTGAIILGSIAVIFAPMVLDGEGIERRELPAMPGPDASRAPATLAASDSGSIAPTHGDWAFLEEVDARRASDDELGVVGLPRHEEVPSELLEGGVPSLAPDGTPNAFSVQVGSFENEENARRLKAELLADGYEAYVTTFDGPPVRHRVAVGPRIDVASVTALQAELAERYDFAPIIVRFTIHRDAG